MIRRRRPQGAIVFTYRRRWPTVAAVACGLLGLWGVSALAGFPLGVLAALVVGGLTYRYFHGLGRGR